MEQYIIRIDDASERRDLQKWNYMELLLDKYSIKPLVGVIPKCEDEEMLCYKLDENFWNKVLNWEKKGWVIAIHGYNHVYSTEKGGINPINNRSEFAGVPIEVQKTKIKKGLDIMKQKGIVPKVFFAPAHTFDENTIIALKECSEIRIISDTIACKPYFENGITYVPQQSGKARRLPLGIVTFCYHPNMMNTEDFVQLEEFLRKYKEKFVEFPIEQSQRKKNIIDKIMSSIYYMRRK